MYLGKKNLNNPELYNEMRALNEVDKRGAVSLAFIELDGIINKSQLAVQYFDKSHAWLSQKIHGCTVLNHTKAFTEEEYGQLAEAFRDIARRLLAHADEIDAMPMKSTEDPSEQ